jgi:hypothetical protein
MGKAVFISIIIIHGLIHLMGFAKSFGLLRITELSQDISKPLGLLWLLSAILFFSVGILYLSNKDWWWIPGIFAIILSLFLIVVFWQDAKFGIIPNIIILAAVVIGFALDLTEDVAEENRLQVDTEGFNRMMEEQRERARQANKSAGAFAQEIVISELMQGLNAASTIFTYNNRGVPETGAKGTGTDSVIKGKHFSGS